MENSNLSLRKIFRIAKCEYIKWIANPRLIIMIVMLIFIKSCAIDPLLEHCIKMNSKINIIEVFIAIANSNMLLLIIPAVYLVLMSDFPKTDGNSLFYIIRCGKLNWLLGQLLFAVMTIISFLGIILIGIILLSARDGFIGNEWSDVITKYNSMFPNDSYSFVSQLIEGRIYNQMMPFIAFINSFLLIGSYLFFIDMILTISFLLNNKALGIFINSAVMAIGTALVFIETKSMWLLPNANSLIGLHYTNIYRKPIQPVYVSYIYYFVINIVFILISIRLMKKYNIADVKDEE